MKTTKKQRAWETKFDKAMRLLLDELGTKFDDGEINPRYAVETIAGTLRVTIYEDWLACLFDDVAKARELVPRGDGRLNVFSGKWNWHFILDQRIEDCVTAFWQGLRPLLPT
jgi:hypothetical protein